MSSSPAAPAAPASLSFVLNGRVVHVDVARFDPNTTTLSQWLRATGNTGTKEGCAEGDCGACSVALASVDVRGARTWRSMTSCITFLPQIAGREIVTAEGLAADDGALHAVQATMVQHLGSQCGYCTPGFVTSMFEGFERPSLHADDGDGISDQLCGNLCRCTGYRPIRDAMCHALRARDAAARGEPLDDTLVAIGTRAATPRPHDARATPDADHAVDVQARTRFVRPTSLPELLALKHTHRAGAMLVAGATELGVLLRKRHTEFPLLVSTEGVAALRGVQRTQTAYGDAWIVGGAATLTEFEEAIVDDAAMQPVRKMLRVFASRQIRNRATLVGNVVTASPIGDMPPVLLALGAIVVARSQDHTREIAIDDFFTGYRKTALHDDEIVERIIIPRPRGRLHTFKVSKRRELDISIVSAALHFVVDDGGVIRDARCAFGGVAATPSRARRTEAALLGKRIDDPHALHAATTLLQDEFQPIDDARAHASFRRGLVASLFEKAWRNAEDVDSEGQDAPLDFVRTDESSWHAAEASVASSVGSSVELHSRLLVHDSARAHVTGQARYVDDVAARRGDALALWPVTTRSAHAKILRRDATAARTMPGVRAVLLAEDIPGDNDVGAVRHDETLLARDEVMFFGHIVGVVVADTIEQARAAAQAVVVELQPLPAILGIPAALDAGSFHTDVHRMKKGDGAAALSTCAHRLQGELVIGGQEHFYLETHAAFAEPGEDGDVHVWSSTQHPSEVQAVVSHVLHVPRHQVVVTSPRMGGGFGGKETQGNTWAALAALAATKTQRPVAVQLDRDVDMELTGKRHPFLARFEAGFSDDGRVHALAAQLYSDGGWALDLSESIHDRALFHLDNAYDIPHVEASGRVCKTHVVSHTAFRGFGGPQGMLVVEEVMRRVARATGLPPDVVRARNFYAPTGGVTHYGQPVDDHRIPRMWDALLRTSDFTSRRADIDAFNATHPTKKRGLAITPVKFGISFTASFLNQAGALVLVFRDGSVQVNHGGTEMGQGLYAKIVGIAMRELGLPRDRIRVMQTRTDKVPNTSATAASSGADLNGAAVKVALDELKARLRPIAASLLEHKLGRPVAVDDVKFHEGHCIDGSAPTSTPTSAGVAFEDVAATAYLKQVSLSSTGFYRTPDIGYDKRIGRGRPFHYFAYGVCVAEVELDGLSGMKRVRRVDVLHDVGDSLNPAIDRGQIEGALVQGIGWLTAEELVWGTQGRLLSHSASTYQIPTIGDAPPIVRVQLLDDHATQDGVVHGSKAVGEPPFMLAIAVREALCDAVHAFGVDDALPSPLTHEVLFGAVADKARARPDATAAE